MHKTEKPYIKDPTRLLPERLENHGDLHNDDDHCGGREMQSEARLVDGDVDRQVSQRELYHPGLEQSDEHQDDANDYKCLLNRWGQSRSI